MKLVIGTRGSKLALAQTNYVIGLLKEKTQEVGFEIKIIMTTGDKLRDTPLAKLVRKPSAPANAMAKIGGKGIFIKEIDEAVATGKVDFAVHSMKDVPTELRKGLDIVSVPRRENPADALVSRENAPFERLPEKAVIGTSSLRRRAEALHKRRDLVIKDVRGNVDTRLRKLRSGEYDALIMANAGLKRLGFEEVVTQELPVQEFLPAVGQGAVAVVAPIGSEHIKLLRTINHEESLQRVKAERAFLRRLGGGCQVPMGVYTEAREVLRMKAAVFASDGDRKVATEVKGDLKHYEELGVKCAEDLLSKGAGDLMDW